MRYKTPIYPISRSKKLFSALLVSGIMSSCSSDPTPDPYPFLRNTSLSPPTRFTPFRRTNWSSPAMIAEGEFLVYFDPNASVDSVNRIHQQISDLGARKLGQASLLRMIQYKIDDGVDMNQLLDFALRQPGVITAQPNFAVSPLITLSPEVQGDVSDGYWWINSIRAREAWDFVESNRSTYVPVPMALVDSGGINPSGPLRNRGVQSFTPCLAGSNITYSITSVPGSSCFSNGFVPWSHANTVGTLLAASGTDGIAGVGVAWRNPVLYFNTGPFFTSRNTGASTYLSPVAFVTAAISLAVEGGARAVNVSLGIGCTPVDTIQSCQNKRASARANFIRPLLRANQANSLVVFAAGNDGFKHDDVLLPRESNHFEYLFRSNALTVGGVDELDNPVCHIDYFSDSLCGLVRFGVFGCSCMCHAADFSHTLTTEGSAVEISAPGYRISIPQDDGSVSVSSSSFGTSLSSPMVAGTAALVWGLNPNLRAIQVKQILLDTARSATSLGGCRALGRGILDAAAAVRRARNFQTTRTGILTRSYYRAFFTSDGNIIGFVAGGDSPTSIIKTNPNGSVLWSYPVGQYYFISDMIQTSNGDLITSSVSRTAQPSLLLHRIRPDGQATLLDAHGFGAYSSDTYARLVFRERDGFLVVAGGPFLSDSNPNQNIVAFNSSGNLVWSNSIENFSPKQIYLSDNGGFLLTGSNNSSPEVVLVDQNGRVTSRRTFSTSQNVPTNSTSLGGNVAFLYPNTPSPFSSMNVRILTNLGADIGSASFALNPNTRSFNVRTSFDNNLLIFGYVDSENSENNRSDLFFMKVRSDGSIIFSNIYRLPDSELPKEIFETSDGYYFCFYYGNQTSSGPQPALLHLDQNGNLIR